MVLSGVGVLSAESDDVDAVEGTMFSGQVLGLVVPSRVGVLSVVIMSTKVRTTAFSCDFLDDDRASSVVLAEYDSRAATQRGYLVFISVFLWRAFPPFSFSCFSASVLQYFGFCSGCSYRVPPFLFFLFLHLHSQGNMQKGQTKNRQASM